VSGRVLRGKTDEIVAGHFEVSPEDELPTVGEATERLVSSAMS
jgi:hypothetical protein